MTIGIIGGGSWATALAKILTDNGNTIYWWLRSESIIKKIKQKKYNPNYLSSAYFNIEQLKLTNSLEELFNNTQTIVIALPSAFIDDTLDEIPKALFKDKKIISAVKGILPNLNILLNEYLFKNCGVKPENYFSLLGPCHAEEVAAERLSYLTFSGNNITDVQQVASYFKTNYINTVCNTDVQGAQYAAVLKNIYALGAGIAHGLDYGDNFLSVYITNAADEMISFCNKLKDKNTINCSSDNKVNYCTSVYLGDLLVTCYSLHSRNRLFGNYIGNGYSVKAAALELNMVAEGYNASKCIYKVNKTLGAHLPIATTIYKILWESLEPEEGFKLIENNLI